MPFKENNLWISDRRFLLTKENEFDGGAIRLGSPPDTRNDLKFSPAGRAIDVSSSRTMYAILLNCDLGQ